MPTTLQIRQITEGFRNFPQKLKRYVSSITGSRSRAANEQGVDAVKAYLRAKAEDHIVLNEAKLIRIGEGEVGKIQPARRAAG